jgi:hypothetical protein
MSSLLAKLEALVDEATLLVKEERARRNCQPFLGARPDLYGPKGTEIHWAPTQYDRTGCAPNHWPDFVGVGNWDGHGILDTPKAT